MTYRVLQWNVGNAGCRSLIAIHYNPHLELVGCVVHAPEKDGVDAGELAGIGPIDVIASRDVESLLALKPDCVSYNSLWANTDDFCRILERGINIVTTSAFITGHALGQADRNRIEEACRRGNSSIFGSLISLVAAGLCDRIEIGFEIGRLHWLCLQGNLGKLWLWQTHRHARSGEYPAAGGKSLLRRYPSRRPGTAYPIR